MKLLFTPDPLLLTPHNLSTLLARYVWNFDVIGTEALAVGDKVVSTSWAGCLNCDACQSGNNLLCEDRNAAGMFGVHQDGG